MNPNESLYPTGDHNNVQPEYGISMRQYFACMAMQGLITSAPDGQLGNSKEGSELAVQWADALITALNK